MLSCVNPARPIQTAAPRSRVIHFAAWYYTGAKLKQQLDGAARSFVNHPRGISFVGGKVQASSIYDWFADDFGGFDGVVRHMKSYAGVALGKQLAGLRKIDAYDYDWKLNDLQR